MKRLLWVPLLALAACEDPEVARADRVHDMMSEVVQPAADGVWKHSGWDVTEAGERSLFPTDDAGWTGVADSARALQRIGADLKSDRYSPGEDAWTDYADGIVLAAEEIERAAEAQDEDGVFNAGGILYNACRGCHERYIVEAENEMNDPAS